MYRLLLLIILFGSFSSNAQMIIREKKFANGLTYPMLEHPHDTSAYIGINNAIYLGLSDLEDNDYCMSDYGYVQKGSHLQLEVMCNCIEMDQGEFRYFLFSTDADKEVPYSDLFEEKSRIKAIEYIQDRIDSYLLDLGEACSDAFADRKVRHFDELNIRMKKAGLEISPSNPSCVIEPLIINWADLKDYLKFNYI